MLWVLKGRDFHLAADRSLHTLYKVGFFYCFKGTTCCFPFSYSSFHSKNGFICKSKIDKDHQIENKTLYCYLRSYFHELQTNSFPQSSSGISLVDQIQRLFHPNLLPCLFYLVHSSSVIIQIHAFPLQHRHCPATTAYFINDNGAYSFHSSFCFKESVY